jgi:hypothetical protein
MYTDSIEQLRGTAGARQVRVPGRDCAGGIHHSKQWRLDHGRRSPELTDREKFDINAINDYNDGMQTEAPT